MRRATLVESLVVVGAIAVVGAVLWSARGMPPESQRFPVLIAVVLLGLLVVQFLLLQRRTPGAARRRVMDLRIGGGSDGRQMLRRGGGFVLWLVALLVAVYTLGFRIGGMGVLFLHIRFGFRERWLVAAAITLAVAVVFTIAVEVLHVPVHRGVLL
jgi:hypothetical protein